MSRKGNSEGLLLSWCFDGIPVPEILRIDSVLHGRIPCRSPNWCVVCTPFIWVESEGGARTHALRICLDAPPGATQAYSFRHPVQADETPRARQAGARDTRLQQIRPSLGNVSQRSSLLFLEKFHHRILPGSPRLIKCP